MDPLKQAATNENVDDCLVLSSNDKKYTNETGETDLMIASKRGHYNCVENLLQSKVKKVQSKVQKYKYTSKMLAIALSKRIDVNEKIFKRERIATTNKKYTTWVTAKCSKISELLLKAVQYVSEKDRNGKDALMHATRDGHLHIVELLLKWGSKVSAVDNYGWDALMTACAFNRNQVAELLINWGSDVNRCDIYGQTAIYISTLKGFPNCVDILLKRGCNITQVDKQGLNALMLASRNGQYTIVQQLLNSVIDQVDENGNTSLMIASWHGHDEVVNQLLIRRCNIKIKNKDGQDALTIACNKGYYKVVQLLLSIHNELNCEYEKIEDSMLYNALIIASKEGHDTIVQLLLTKATVLNQNNKYRFNALMLAANDGNETLLKCLIKNGTDLTQVNEDGFSALMCAANTKRANIIEMLLEQGVDLNNTNRDGFNALMIASNKGDNETVKMLLNKGANLNQVNKRGENALMLASTAGYEEIVEVLIENGIDLNQVDKDGFNALMRACFKGYSKVIDLLINGGINIHQVSIDGFNSLMIASNKGHEKIVDLLIRKRCNVNLMNEKGNDALMMALNMRHYNILEILLKCEVDLNRVYDKGYTILMTASYHNQVKAVELFLKCGCDVNHVNQYGFNALMLASARSNVEIVNLLIHEGCNVNQTDIFGQDALMIASLSKNDKMLRLLLENGADINSANKQGENALMISASNNQCSNVELLLANIYCLNESTEQQTNSLIQKRCITRIELCLIAFCNRNLQIIKSCCKNLESNSSTSSSNTLTLFEKRMYDELFKFWPDQTTFTNVSSVYDNKEQLEKQSTVDLPRSFLFSVSFSCNMEAYLNQRFEILLDIVGELLTEFSNTKHFDVFYYYMLQKCLNLINMAISAQDDKKASRFLSMLLERDYAEKTVTYIEEKGFLNVSDPGFCLQFIRDTIFLLTSSVMKSKEFVLRLAESNILKIFIDYLILIRDKKSLQIDFLTTSVIQILGIFVYEDKARELIDCQEICSVLRSMTFTDKMLLYCASILTGIESIPREANLGEAGKVMRKVFSDMQQLSMSVYLNKINSVLINNITSDEQVFSINEVVEKSVETCKSQDIESFGELLDQFIESMHTFCVHFEDIPNLHTLFSDSREALNFNPFIWLLARTTGTMPNSADFAKSTEFPDDFEINMESFLGEGGFGSVHLVIDKKQPKEKQFVAKKLTIAKSCLKIIKNEVMIMLKTRHERIVKIHGYKKEEHCFYIFLDYLRNVIIGS